jgi:hypothetical protein
VFPLLIYLRSERSALDEINTKHSDASKKIVSEELGQDTFSILRAASSSVAATIYGASQLNEADKTRIARTLRGSLYFTELWGNDEEGLVPGFSLCLRLAHSSL